MFRRIEDEAIFEARRQNISLQSAKYEEIFLERLSRWNEMLSSRGRLMSNAWANSIFRQYNNVLQRPGPTPSSQAPIAYQTAARCR
jgi:hypothetical protein